MSRQLRIDFPGAIHHITRLRHSFGVASPASPKATACRASRGNERRIIYRDDRDRVRFLEILEEVVILRRWILHAWVFMSNHYHLLIEAPEVGLSRGMKKLNESYARWFNERHRRVGHLFQGRFKNIVVERESHLLELTRYIVLNPVRCGAVSEFNESPETLRTKNHRPGRKAFAMLAYRECGLTMQMIAEYLGVAGQGVSKMIRAAEELERGDRTCRESLKRIRSALS